VTAATGLKPRGWCGDATFADVNDDGRPDVYVLNMQGDNHYFENVGGRTFVEKTETYFPKTPWGAMGVKFFDYDDDGRLDLFVTDMHSDMSEEVVPAGRREQHLGQRGLPQPRRREVRGDLRPAGLRELLALGLQRR
jgi:hypothetical protein